jgi:uncharacterized protein (TIGR02271 family)
MDTQNTTNAPANSSANTTTTDRETIAGLFQNRTDADRAVQALLDAGYTNAEIDVTPYGNVADSENINFDGSYYSRPARYTHNDTAVQGYLVTITGARAQQARTILERYNADLQSGYLSGLAQEGAQRLLLREEQLRATKQQVEAGEVTLRKEVVTENKTIEVPVTREEVVIERHAVNPHTPADGPITADSRTISVPVMEERVSVEKTPVVTEEVTIGKRQVQENQVVSDTVRHEEARLENATNARVTGAQISDTDEMLDEDTADAGVGTAAGRTL